MPEISNEEDNSVPAPQGAGPLPGERAIAPESQRVYVDAAVNFRAEGGRAATGFVKDLSMTGMFVATDTLYLSGTEIEFSIRVGEVLLEGTGRVVWQRAAPSSRGLPIGIGVSFDRLDPDSRANIRELVGGLEKAAEPAKLEELREAVSAGLDANRDWRPATARDGIKATVYRAQRNRPERRGWGVPLASALVIALLFFFGMGLQNRLAQKTDAAPSPPESRDQQAAASASASDETTDEGTTDESGPAEAAEAAEEVMPTREDEPIAEAASESEVALQNSPVSALAAEAEAAVDRAAPEEDTFDVQAVETAVSAWAQAWQGQQVDDYLEAYISGYAPGSTTHEDWRAQRRSRLLAPSVIEVEIEDLTVEPGNGPDAATAIFVQRYRSDQYRDVVRKRLELEREGDAWKIRSESSTPL